MVYQNIVKAGFIERPNRFVARVSIGGREESAHVKNTGRCRELLVPGAEVFLEDHEGRMGKRKYRYSLIAVMKGSLLINMDSQAPNQAVKEALESGSLRLPGMGKLKAVRPETKFGASRFDFFVRDESGAEGYAEVKGVTLEEGGVCLFPDAPTERGVKHLNELVAAKEAGYMAYVIFVIQMKGMKYFAPNEETHAAFGEALRKARESGVNVIAFECDVTPESLILASEIPVRL